MLEFRKVRHPDQIKALLKQFNPAQQTWIVSDLKSKQEIQAECIARFGYFTDDSILRISDFWRLWIRRLKPTLQVVASDFIKSLVQLFLEKYASTLGFSANDQSTLERYVQELAPLILHPESDTLLQEWLQAQPGGRKWQKWYKVARVCTLFIVNEKKVIDVKWSAAYLQSLDLDQIQWDSELIIDLGTELTSVEMGLLKLLSQKQEVLIHVPQPAWHERFPFLLKTYTENFGYGKVSDLEFEQTGFEKTEKFFIRLSTQLAEVKYAVSKVREWLDLGVPFNQIAIIAVQIEDYWPVLESYLSEEGIPSQKDQMASVNSLADVQTYLAHLKSLTDDVSFESLQQSFFHNKVSPEMRYEKFRALFNQLFDEEDLKRDEQIKNLFYKKINFANEISRDEFFALLLKIWASVPENKNSAALFELLFKDFLAQSVDTSLKFAAWLQFFKSRLSHKELRAEYSYDDGIQVLSLMSAQMCTAGHRVYLGLFDEAFKAQKKSLLPLSDIELLKNQFDLAIPYPEESHLDFNLRWQTESNCQKIILTAPHLSFSAEPLTPCLYFLENNPKSEIVTPGLTRNDELQQKFSLAKGDDIGEYEGFVSQSRLQQDLNGAEIEVHHPVFGQLAASEVENYAQCSFKLLASKGFRLRELPEVSIDLDPRQKGTLVHALFEFLIHNLQKPNFQNDEVNFFLNTKRKELGLFVNEDQFWAVQLSKLMLLAEKFIDFEKFRVQYFDSSTEVSFEIFFDPESKQFLPTNSATSIGIRGRIDRLDKIKGTNEYLIYDYKSSGGQASNYGKWMSDYQFQLLLYLFAVEVSLFQDAEVKGALYYLYKNFDIGKGFVNKTTAIEKLNFSGHAKSSLAEPDEVQELKSQFVEFLSQSFLSLKRGEFKAVPYDTEICSQCDWRKLCRAQHLM